MTVVKAILFILWTLFVLAVMGIIIRIFWKALKSFHGSKSDDMMQRILDTADRIGVDTGGVRKLLETIIGQKVRELGFIEARKYGRLDIEYSAQLRQVEGEKQIVLIVLDQAVESSLLDFSKRRDEYRIPIRKGAEYNLISILENDEEEFLRTAADCEARIQMNELIKKDPIKKIKNTLLRCFAFRSLKSFGQIDRISERIPLSNERRILFDMDISAYIGKESDEILLVLRFEMKYKETGVQGGLHHILYYPFGAEGRKNLRRILKEGTTFFSEGADHGSSVTF